MSLFSAAPSGWSEDGTIAAFSVPTLVFSTTVLFGIMYSEKVCRTSDQTIAVITVMCNWQLNNKMR